MRKGLAIGRTESALLESIRQLEALCHHKKLSDADQNRTLLAAAMLKSAWSRRESRGVHQRLDYPQMNEEYQKITVAIFYGKDIQIQFRDLPRRKEGGTL